MKMVYQFCVILTVSLAGELLHQLLPLPIPASIYGLVLMLVLLERGVLRLQQVEEAGSFLIEIMPVLFVPSAAGLLIAWDELRSFLIPFLVILVVTTWLVLAVSGKLTQILLDGRDGRP